ncbi:hypothetical protein VTJ83DRAFT_5818 [Remersonia thermophila]|uniref:Origin recognition complex subunit 2 n=1 Tax=Remersonia thermophila TaxID=72144 RepID=A0ABR4D9J4_9PEZI
MARSKAVQTAPIQPGSRKRALSPADPYEVPADDAETPRRRRRTEPSTTIAAANGQHGHGNPSDSPPSPQRTPAKRRGRPPKAAGAGAAATPHKPAATPKSARERSLPATPLKPNGIDTPSRRTIADRSARRKSARALIDRVIGGTVSDDDLEDDAIAREIYESSEDDDADGEDREDQDEENPEPTTPSKTPGRKRRTARRSPTPPRDLPPHEQYFYQNKPGLAKTSGNTLASLNLLTHEEYFSILRQLKDPHAADVQFLESLHAESFPQWAFELSQGFSACLYGYGSKRRLLHSFARYLAAQDPSHKIVIINGYVRTLNVRDMLSTISAALPPADGAADSHPSATTTLASLLSHLATLPPAPQLTLLVSSIDSPLLRAKPALQSLLAALAAQRPRVRLACTADTPGFPRLWDAGLRAQFAFVFHDCTTFSPFAACELDAVDEVHELLGRRARRAGGKEGVVFVLRSLPENARALFRLLVGEVLVAMEEQGGAGTHDDDEVAVEYRMVYNKAVEEFICSSEMAFRTLLKEFHDHQIITSSKDSLGTELLSLPFRKDELESILEELVS